MATTSIWRVKGYINNLLMYAQNPEKTTHAEIIRVPDNLNRDSLEDVIAYAGREEATNKRQLVWGINCNPATARDDMLRVKRAYDKEGGTIAYHGYQSFKEGEVTPELAHKIGIRLAQELWGDRYQVLVCTHLDKMSHIHNHLILNTVSFVDGIKYHRTKEDYQRMREVSDRLCREYGLSVVKHPEGKGKNYAEWDAEKNGKPTYRSRIREDIDRAIAASLTDTEFYDELEAMGYELKLTSPSGKPLQRPSLKPKGSERYFRFDRLGEDYCIDEIENRILENIRRKDPFPEETQKAVRKYRAKHPPVCKPQGLARLYYYYCYELHIIVRYPSSVQRVSHFLREDLRKLDQLDAQTRFLGENRIETYEDLSSYREKAATEIDSLKTERDSLRNELKRVVRKGDESEITAVKAKIAEVTAKIQKLRDGAAICDSVEKRAVQLQAEYDSLRNENKEKEETNDELFGRSGGTGREDESERRGSRS
jgi:cell division protein FtsB